MNFKALIIGLLGYAAMGCQPKTVGLAVQAMSSDAYVRKLETGNHKIEFRFIPETLYYLKFSSLDSNRAFTPKLVDSIKHSGSLVYGLMFTMTLSPKIDTLLPTDYRNDVVYGEITGEENYRTVLNDFLSGLQSKIWLEIAGKKHMLRTYQMVNSWGMSKSRTFTLVFDPVENLVQAKKGKIVLVLDNLVPGQGRDKLIWQLPINRYDFI